ncbi:MAG: acyl-CoA dehydrogenase family protein [Nocardioidaceae bacterium]
MTAPSGAATCPGCLQIHGGYGVTKDLPFERWYRELRIPLCGSTTGAGSAPTRACTPACRGSSPPGTCGRPRPDI